jgi:hypothetical protein
MSYKLLYNIKLMGRNKKIKSDEELDLLESRIILTKTINKEMTNKIKEIQNNFINNNIVSIP